MIYHFKSLVLVRKGRAFYATLYQEVFFGNPGGGGSLTDYQCTPSARTMECAGRSVLYRTCVFRKQFGVN